MSISSQIRQIPGSSRRRGIRIGLSARALLPLLPFVLGVLCCREVVLAQAAAQSPTQSPAPTPAAQPPAPAPVSTPATQLPVAQPSAEVNNAEMNSRDEPTTFKVNVRLVLVRVVARDPKGHAVGNLHKEDFQLFDKGKPQVISQFSVEQPGAQVALDRKSVV